MYEPLVHSSKGLRLITETCDFAYKLIIGLAIIVMSSGLDKEQPAERTGFVLY